MRLIWAEKACRNIYYRIAEEICEIAMVFVFGGKELTFI